MDNIPDKDEVDRSIRFEPITADESETQHSPKEITTSGDAAPRAANVSNGSERVLTDTGPSVVAGVRFVPLTIRGGPAIITLTRGLSVKIDAEDFEAVVCQRWYAHKSRGGWYAARRMTTGIVYLHRFLLPGAAVVDHKNLDTLDCQRKNLRPADRSTNAANTRKKPGASGYRGVSWHKGSNLWCAAICKDGKSTSLGYFRDPAEAGRVYDEAARRLYGEFRTTNHTLSKLAPGGRRQT